MKPNLILGLGNPLMGDDGIGWRVAESLAEDPDTEVQCGGSDLLRWADQMAGRRRVILIDAMLADVSPGSVQVFEEPFPEFEVRQGNAHHLSPLQAVALLRALSDGLSQMRFTLVTIGIASARLGDGLSAALAARLPEIVDQVSTMSVAGRR